MLSWWIDCQLTQPGVDAGWRALFAFAGSWPRATQAEVPIILYAYPCNLGNVTFSTGIFPSWIWEDVSATATFDGNHAQISGARPESVNGFGDIQVAPIQASWTNGDFTVGGIFNVWAPSGTYNAGQLANPGMGYYTFELMSTGRETVVTGSANAALADASNLGGHGLVPASAIYRLREFEGASTTPLSLLPFPARIQSTGPSMAIALFQKRRDIGQWVTASACTGRDCAR
jgi:hypothetical protein